MWSGVEPFQQVIGWWWFACIRVIECGYTDEWSSNDVRVASEGILMVLEEEV